ncbi:S-adenosylmethionine decarboxylase/ornithine decarboxylase, putative [Plasmodium relictum]|uniref:S-adenosylmethionine decarboxylase/ornithine decarboxylase, putative n=1 Tax=Plasmodium relictum TaxID=85471 RepID=A0A1J1H2N9_PLARL|nr:S-adenosylmethionine decarboxylase/ornithine decarboxylase, putative [Plasmodium relictum]CRG99193.1 S-adenosylmethionine decarboxylase/ornithine decarboxylase, putative [Plasmodium relictum]
MTGIFEGIEKRVVMKLKKNFFCNEKIKSLLDISDEFWSEKLKLIGCTIISKIEEDTNLSNNEKCRVYLLSESSLFIHDNVLFLKTCGRTKVLFFIPFLVDLLLYILKNKSILDKNCKHDETFLENNDLSEITDFIKNNFEYTFFTHMNYQNISENGHYEQEYPHKTIEDEKKFFRFFFSSMKFVNTPLPLDRNHYIFYARVNNTFPYASYKFCSELLLFDIKKHEERKKFHRIYLNKDSMNIFHKKNENFKLYDENEKAEDYSSDIFYVKSTEEEGYEDEYFNDEVDYCEKSNNVINFSEESSINMEQNLIIDKKKYISNTYLKDQEKNEKSSEENNSEDTITIKKEDYYNFMHACEEDINIFSYPNIIKTSCNKDHLGISVCTSNTISTDDEIKTKKEIRNDKERKGTFLNGKCVHNTNNKEVETYCSVREHFDLQSSFTSMKNDCALNYLERGNTKLYNYNDEDLSNISIKNVDTDLYECINKNKESFSYNEYYFTPCGYSCNAIHKNNYFCVHYSPEDLVSYVSIEISNNLEYESYLKFINNQLNFYNGKYLYIINYLNECETNENIIENASSENKSEKTEIYYDNIHDSYYIKNKLSKNFAINNQQYYNLVLFKEQFIDFLKIQYFVYELKNINDVKIFPLLSEIKNIEKNYNSDILGKKKFLNDIYEYSYNFCKKNKITIVDMNSLENDQMNKFKIFKKDFLNFSYVERKKDESVTNKNYEKINKNGDLNNCNINEKNYVEIKYACKNGINKSNESNANIDNYSNETYNISNNNSINKKDSNLNIEYERNNVNNEVCEAINECKEKKYKEGMIRFFEKNITEMYTFDKILNENIDTSVLLINLEKILVQYIRFKKNLPNVTPFYSVKCNDDEIVLKFLYGLNCNFDCASVGEIKKIITILPQISRERIIYANTIKSINSLIYAQKENINLCTFDNIEELKKIYKYHPNCSLLLRINVDFKNYKSYMSSKYGANKYEWEELLEFGKNHKLNIIGVSFHVGSNTKNLFDYCQAIKLSKEVWDLSKKFGYNFEILNLGGGYPEELEYDNVKNDEKVNYCTLNEEELKKDIINFLNEKNVLKKKYFSYNFEKIALAINISIEHYFKEIKDKIKIICEPGRYMAASSTLLAVKIIGKRHPTFKGVLLKDIKEPFSLSNNININDVHGNIDEKKKDKVIENKMHENIINTLNNNNSKLGNITNIKKKVVNINDNRYNYYSYYVSDSIYGCFSSIIFDEYNRTPMYIIKNERSSNDIFNSPFYLANIFGQSCDGLDMINSITYLPECDINDWLIYEYTGAYTFVGSSNFNGFPKSKKIYIYSQKNHFNFY